jgi:hypothetical protein
MSLFLFAILCLLIALAWDVGYARVYMLTHADVDHVPFWIPFVVVPVSLCAASGYVAGQWRRERDALSVAGAVSCCLVAPFAAILPFLWVMCSVFDSCMDD